LSPYDRSSLDPSLFDPIDGTETFVEPTYSSWDGAQHGPEPRPDWVVTEFAAVDTELGVLKTGKEADVHLVHRGVPGGRECLLAAKRYRTADHRLFHRDAAYQEGRTTRRTRDVRAMEGRTGYGKRLLAGQWAFAEFGALDRLWTIGAPVPYPVQLLDTELMLEFVGEPDGTAAPRLAQYRPDRDELADLYAQCVDVMVLLAREGLAHGDLSAYNLLVHRGALIMIDVPQIVDLFANPQGPDFLERDCANVATWFSRRGLAVDAQELFGDLMAEAVARW